jgi:DNA polymerase elongation subunit (family B)
MSSSPRVLILDIETSPNMAHVWGLFNQNVGLSQLLESGEVICWAAKWLGAKQTVFKSVHHHGREEMLKTIYDLVDEADVVVHYNGVSFDMKWLNAEWAREGWSPPSPYQQVDLLRVVKSQFRFPSNKLDYVSQTLKLGKKTTHTGHQLWLDCLAGKEEAWKLMRKYNRQDVALTETLYERLKPWIKNPPHTGLYTDTPDGCPECGSTSLQKRGTAYTAASAYQRFLCNDCGRWSRSTLRHTGVTKKAA